MSEITEYIQMLLDQPNAGPFLQWALWIAAAAFGCFLVARLLLGFGHNLDANFRSAVAIVLVYVTAICFFGTDTHYTLIFSSLPHIDFVGDYMTILSLKSVGLSAFCAEVVSTLMLCIVIELLNLIMPKGNFYISWLFFRYVTAVFGIAGHYGLSLLCERYLPGVIISYAPVIIVLVLLGLILLYILNWVLTVQFSIAFSPVVGIIFNFITGNLILKTISKAVVKTFLVALAVMLLDLFNVTLVHTLAAAVVSFVPAVLIISVVIYLVFKVL